MTFTKFLHLLNFFTSFNTIFKNKNWSTTNYYWERKYAKSHWEWNNNQPAQNAINKKDQIELTGRTVGSRVSRTSSLMRSFLSSKSSWLGVSFKCFTSTLWLLTATHMHAIHLCTRLQQHVTNILMHDYKERNYHITTTTSFNGCLSRWTWVSRFLRVLFHLFQNSTYGY